MRITRCAKFENRIDEYFFGELGEKDAAEVLSHVKTCDNCARAFKLTEELIRGVKDMRLAEPPEGFDEAVLSRVLTADGMAERAELRERAKSSRTKNRIWAFAVSYAGVFAVSVSSAVFLLFRNRETVGKGIFSAGSSILEGIVEKASEISRMLQYVGSALKSLQTLEKLSGGLPGLIPGYVLLLFLVVVPAGLIAFLREILVLDEKRN